MGNRASIGLLGALVLVLATGAKADVFNMGPDLTSLEFVSVRNAGNDGELSGAGSGAGAPTRVCGAVAYDYRMGKFEVTAGQYCEFLNAVAKADTYGLYSVYMSNPGGDPASNTGCGCNIQRTFGPDGYTYSVPLDWANRPVNYVSWGDAARFCNWLTKGQPTGDQDLTTTEDGSYHLNGATSDASLLAVTRNPNARYVIPTEDEWYKAAYHKNDGVTGNYFDCPTTSDTGPSNGLVDPDPGNNANIYHGDWPDPAGYSIGPPYYRTHAGEFENSESPYGTFDQGGNVWESNEAIIYTATWGVRRGIRGGSFFYDGEYVHAACREPGFLTTDEYPNYGFRVAEVPEPATLSLLALGGALVALRRGRRRRARQSV